MNNNTRRHYLVLLLLVLLFAAPGLTAYIVYFHPQWLTQSTTNRGQFVTPPVKLEALGHHSKWRIVLWNLEEFDKTSLEQLDKLARIRVALGRHLYNVELTILSAVNTNPIPSEFENVVEKTHASIVVLSSQESARLIRLYPKSALFLANPDNFLVLTYPLTAEADDVYHDIKHLLTKG